MAIVHEGMRLLINKSTKHSFTWFLQIFQELATFDVSDAFGIGKEEGHFWWPGLGSQRKRRSSVFSWHWDITKDAMFAFTVSEANRIEKWLCGDLYSLHKKSEESIVKL